MMQTRYIRAMVALSMAVCSVRCLAVGATLDLHTDQPVPKPLPAADTINLRGAGTGSLSGGMDYVSQINKYDSGSWELGGNIGHSEVIRYRYTYPPTTTDVVADVVAHVDVWSGQLVIFGDLNGQVVVHSGARLEGVTSDFIGGSRYHSVSVQSGGIFLPGYHLNFDPRPLSNRTLIMCAEDFLRNLTLATGSTMEIQANGNNNTYFAVTGTASLSGTLSVKDLSGNNRRAAIKFMTVRGTLAGSFDEVVDDSPVLEFTLRTVAVGTATEFYLDVSGASYTQFATTANQRRVAAALDTAANAGELPELVTALDSLDAPQLPAAFASLSPQVYETSSRIILSETQSFARALAQASRDGRDGTPRPALASADASIPMLSGTQTDPLMLSQAFTDASAPATKEAVPDSGKLNVIGAYLGQISNVDSSAQRIGYDSTSNGVLVGMDYALSSSTFAGLALSYARTDAQMDGDLGDLTEDTYRVGPYVGFQDGNWHLDGSATMGFHDIDTTRRVAIPGFDRTADASHDAYDAAAYGALSYDIRVKRFTISPLASLQYTYLRQDSFTESGAGPADLSVDPVSTNSLLSIVGARIATTTQIGKLKLLPELFGGWAYESLDNAQNIDANFVESSGAGVSIRQSNPDRSRWLVGAGATLLLHRDVVTYVRYTAELSSSADTHNFGAGVSWRF